jgi:hypothetical protein
MKFSLRAIPAAAAMTASLMLGAPVQAQTTPAPTTAAGDKAAMPAAPNSTSKTMEQRDAAKPMAKSGAMAGSTGTGAHAAMPDGPKAMTKSAEERTAAKANKKPMMSNKASPKPPADETANPGSK